MQLTAKAKKRQLPNFTPCLSKYRRKQVKRLSIAEARALLEATK